MKTFFFALFALLFGVAHAETFPLPANAKITWADDGKGNAVVSWTGVTFDSVTFFAGNGRSWGNKKVVLVAGKNAAVIEDYKKNGVRFNGQRNGLWAHFDCPAQGVHYKTQVLGSDLEVNCDYVDPEDGMPKGAVQGPLPASDR